MPLMETLHHGINVSLACALVSLSEEERPLERIQVDLVGEFALCKPPAGTAFP
jgi:hypothetical protein